MISALGIGVSNLLTWMATGFESSVIGLGARSSFTTFNTDLNVLENKIKAY